jgi:hypothetical protein
LAATFFESDIVDFVRSPAFALACCIAVFGASPAFAQAPPGEATLSPDAQIEIAPEPPQPKSPGEGAKASSEGTDPGADLRADLGPGEAAPPPLRPRHRGLVLESTLGILGFAGQFRHVAPPAYWMHAQLGYELLAWLMLFGEAELALTDTSESQDASQSRAFPLWGLGGGGRASIRVKDFGAFVQGDIGALMANVPHGALGYLGFKSAESFGVQVGGRVGVEWYQKDRHLALTAQGGPRIAQGFAKSAASGNGAPKDLPVMWDTSVGLRYTF